MTEKAKKYDAAIVGGGVIGCSIAWRLAQAGLSVTVIERGKVGQEASWAAGGMLAPFAEADRSDAFLDLALQSRVLYAEFARELLAATGVDIEYRSEGTLYLALSEEDEEELEHRWQWQHEAGLQVKKLTVDCVRKLEPQLNVALRWALKFPDDHQVNNRKLTMAVESAARQAGAEILPNTGVQNLLLSGNQVNGVATSQGEIKADIVIIAAGCWSKLLCAKLPIEPVHGQMMAIKMTAPFLQHVIYSPRGYLIPRQNGIVIAGSTTENKGFEKEVTAGGLAQIIANAREITPQLQNWEIKETWSGLRPGSPDERPILGTDPQITGLLYATGHYRNGILLTPITAQVITEIILRGASEIDLAPFSITRFTSAALSA